MHEHFFPSCGDPHSITARISEVVLSGGGTNEIFVISKERACRAFHIETNSRSVEVVDTVSGFGFFRAEVVHGSVLDYAREFRTVPELIPEGVLECLRNSDGALTLTVRTKKNGQYASMVAGDLFGACWEYLTVIQRLSIGALVDMWPREGELSGSFLSFEQAKATIAAGDPDIPPYYTERLAAFETWSGRQALGVGFDEVRIVPHESKILAMFYRPGRGLL